MGQWHEIFGREKQIKVFTLFQDIIRYLNKLLHVYMYIIFLIAESNRRINFTPCSSVVDPDPFNIDALHIRIRIREICFRILAKKYTPKCSNLVFLGRFKSNCIK